MENSTNRLIDLQNILSFIAKVEVEIGVLSLKKFSFNFEGLNKVAEQKIKTYFKKQMTFDNEGGYDLECDYTSLYATVK